MLKELFVTKYPFGNLSLSSPLNLKGKLRAWIFDVDAYGGSCSVATLNRTSERSRRRSHFSRCNTSRPVSFIQRAQNGILCETNKINLPDILVFIPYRPARHWAVQIINLQLVRELSKSYKHIAVYWNIYVCQVFSDLPAWRGFNHPVIIISQVVGRVVEDLTEKMVL